MEKDKIKTKSKVKIDVRETKTFQLKRAKELGMTLNQYLGKEPIIIINC